MGRGGKRNMGSSDAWIMKNIGMDADELLRLKQISGLQSLFKDKEFSKAWEIDNEDMNNGTDE